MNDQRPDRHFFSKHRDTGFFSTLMHGLLRDLMWLLMAFAIGTAALAVICLYYDVPLVFSLVGGFLVLAFAVVIKTDSSLF